MSWISWLPWRFVVRRIARRQGFVDPIALIARLESFAQPSEVAQPIELLRAGVALHARGLVNSRVVQHNLDWVWPYWIERQFDPRDPSFIPRAFSATHINLSHRNWTAIGYPDCDELPIVDPRGLLTPFLDGWSLDAWLVTDDGAELLPSRATTARQVLDLEAGGRVITETVSEDMTLRSEARVVLDGGRPVCRLHLSAEAGTDGFLVLALRPCNPEGIAIVEDIALSGDRRAWTVNDDVQVRFDRPADSHHVSDYRDGDVHIHLRDREDQQRGRCEAGMATAAAMFRFEAGKPAGLTVSTRLQPEHAAGYAQGAWEDLEAARCRLQCPESRYVFLYDAAVASLVLHSPHDVYPGPYTYKRFWFRDAAFIVHALLCVGLADRAARALERFPARQTARGYFRSQDGEWDSNGEVLWLLKRHVDLSGRCLGEDWSKVIARGAHWILQKRLDDESGAPHGGLLPAGFSAEHLGPNDFYYWDDFWAVAGLRAAAALLASEGDEQHDKFASGATDLVRAVDSSLRRCADRLGRPAMPASPYRRLDAGTVGSLVCGYPLQLVPPDDSRLLDSVEFLLENCFVNGAFYQDMIHSGLNPYLTLHVAQVLLRAGDPRYLSLMDAVAALASQTGQWPEAVHPLTGGGCMGDGHHVWASAEWILMIRNCFLREEEETLVLCGGVPQRWLAQAEPLCFGPAPTAFGTVNLRVEPRPGAAPRVHCRGNWHGARPPRIVIRMPGFRETEADGAPVTLHPVPHEARP